MIKKIEEYAADIRTLCFQHSFNQEFEAVLNNPCHQPCAVGPKQSLPHERWTTTPGTMSPTFMDRAWVLQHPTEFVDARVVRQGLQFIILMQED